MCSSWKALRTVMLNVLLLLVLPYFTKPKVAIKTKRVLKSMAAFFFSGGVTGSVLDSVHSAWDLLLRRMLRCLNSEFQPWRVSAYKVQTPYWILPKKNHWINKLFSHSGLEGCLLTFSRALIRFLGMQRTCRALKTEHLHLLTHGFRAIIFIRWISLQNPWKSPIG